MAKTRIFTAKVQAILKSGKERDYHYEKITDLMNFKKFLSTRFSSSLRRCVLSLNGEHFDNWYKEDINATSRTY